MLIRDLYLLRTWPYRHACENPSARYWISGFLIATGIVYGLFVGAFQRALGGELQGIPVERIPAVILYGGNVLAGLLVTIMVHLGLALVAWLVAKGVGGPGHLGNLYKASAYLLPLGLPALPQIALTTALAGRPLQAAALQTFTIPLAVLGLALFLFGLFQVMILTQGVGTRRAAAAVLMFVVFCYALFLII